ncbi:putative ubiquitin-conjugating enzyme E2 38 [Bidens hawaiensis]|uniref:putative ubiquitin-conjugating enzyme E2 38 n=1 Tax=Bidens hawaiensis TaxID=980011 RepID=UPI00404AA452
MERFSRVGVYPLEDVLRAKTQSQTLPTAMLSDDSVFERHRNFKQFDTVVDFSDHLFSTKPKEQASEYWDAHVHKEFKILEENLPETIFVRAYESRKDLLRAVIIGPKGTPYHDGLFFFDMYFPPKFPLYPPVMRYHSSGFGMNPHLFASDEVCLNLYRVWSLPDEPLWKVCETTVLQLLISIQDRVLNADPLFIQPGMLENGPSVAAEYFSLLYNEDILIKSLKSMVYIMNKPPKNFEAFVLGHFRNRVVDILMACKGYIAGLLQVGANKEGCCSHEFQSNVSECVYRFSLLNAFISIRASKLSILYPPNAPSPVSIF